MKKYDLFLHSTFGEGGEGKSNMIFNGVAFISILIFFFVYKLIKNVIILSLLD
jgi:hypothetical protein